MLIAITSSDLDIDIEDNGDDTFSIYYTVKDAGDYTLSIKFGGQPVPDGFYTFTIRPRVCTRPPRKREPRVQYAPGLAGCQLIQIVPLKCSARASTFSWSELATPLRPKIGALGEGTRIKFLVMCHRDQSCTHRLSILSSQTLFRYSWTISRTAWTLQLQLALSTGSLGICQAFLSRFFSRTCLRIELDKEACGVHLGWCLGVEASSDPLMAEVMNSAPRSISAAVRKIGVGPNLSLSTH
uniref:Uncharacterized protein n=1 Tax=Timema monikensis TaxID=170555 RepID=A0A7R9ECB6_9NEOP|nr:unnamed protein product [Timema monikensis]